MGFPGSLAGKAACNAGDPSLIPGLRRSPGEGNIPRVGKNPWKRERLPTPVFRPRVFHGPHSPWGHNKSDKTEQLSLFTFCLLYTIFRYYSFILNRDEISRYYRFNIKLIIIVHLSCKNSYKFFSILKMPIFYFEIKYN